VTFSTVKVSDLPDVNLTTVDGKDHFIINDNEPGSKTTNIIEIGEFIGYIEGLPLTFKQDITFDKDIYVGGDIQPKPGTSLGITVDDLTIRQELNLENTVVVTGLSLNDLDDVTYDPATIKQGDIIFWDSSKDEFVSGPQSDDAPVNIIKPTAPKEGDLWWRKENGKLYIWYKSPNGTAHWVQASGDFIDP